MPAVHQYPLHDMRKKWIPLLKTAVASIADKGVFIFFYYEKKSLENDNGNDNDNDSDKLERIKCWMLVSLILSCIIGVLTIISLICKGCCPQNTNPPDVPVTGRELVRFHCFVNWINFILSFEMFLADIPQFVLTILIQIELEGEGEFIPAAVFNMTSSAFNFFLNAFALFEHAVELVAVDDTNITSSNFRSTNNLRTYVGLNFD
jgi:hypothetical protein